MAGNSNRKTVQTNQKRKSKAGSGKKTTTKKRMSAAERERLEQQYRMREEIFTLLFFACSILLTLCNFKVTAADGTKKSIIGTFGNVLSGVEFGIFGVLAYAAPLLLFLAVIFGYINQGLLQAQFKLWAGVILFLLADITAALAGGIDKCGSTARDYYEFSKAGKGGGVIGTILAKALHTVFGMVGTVIILLILCIICLVIVTEKSFLNGVKKGSRKVYETAQDDAAYRRELRERRRQERLLREQELQEQERLPKRSEMKVSGVALDTTIPRTEETQDIHELTIPEAAAGGVGKTASAKRAQRADAAGGQKAVRSVTELSEPVREPEAKTAGAQEDPLAHIHIRGLSEDSREDTARAAQTGGLTMEQTGQGMAEAVKQTGRSMAAASGQTMRSMPEPSEPVVQSEAKDTTVATSASMEYNASKEKVTVTEKELDISEDIQKQAEIVPKKEYVFPPLDLLKKGDHSANKDSEKQLKETALHLQETLKTFGVNVTITDISQGPAVTRYELQPEQGVKVSKIVGLSDDIKLNLAATDIRIEAPIPGKAAIGIEVPNKENAAVAFRDLLESPKFQKFDSNLAFAVGKDIAGQTVVTDIAKMPHLLIAGATGSGKSVCINTLIMSLLYKSSPDDVKLIMIDPKVVELSVYNGIPHLMIPVVTDPKKAAGALHWGVAEMTDRYKKFADYNVRKIDEYNKKIEQMETNDGQPLPEKMPQIVIIVDELADLMMVAPGEVEESICRLAQLARAAGIHLVIATQRPSVDVITGLIKANMPSRIAFAVSSGVDSRTILDMNGAEKLLGKGDMLFYPQGMSKPARVQGAFVSDKEVSQVVEFLKGQCGEAAYASDVEQKITASATASGAGVFGQDAGSERDVYFYDAGTFIIEKDKASIGMLQRVFKIGFNRAARIMDQLAEAGVVGEEEGTKPRKVLMTQEQFEELVNAGS